MPSAEVNVLSVPDDEMLALAAVECRRAADMFESLTPEQWAVPSLCARWTVRDLAGHLIGPYCVSTARFLLGRLLAGMIWPDLQ